MTDECFRASNERNCKIIWRPEILEKLKVYRNHSIDSRRSVLDASADLFGSYVTLEEKVLLSWNGTVGDQKIPVITTNVQKNWRGLLDTQLAEYRVQWSNWYVGAGVSLFLQWIVVEKNQQLLVERESSKGVVRLGIRSSDNNAVVTEWLLYLTAVH